MKKLLLTSGAAMLLGMTASAQMPLRNFNAAGLPAGWSMVKGDAGVPSANWVAAIVTGLTNNAWMKWPMDQAGADSALLTTSDFTTNIPADRWVISESFTVSGTNPIIKFKAMTYDASAADAIDVYVSPTGGATVADFTDHIMHYTLDAIYPDWGNFGGPLTAYAGQTIRVAFVEKSQAKSLLFLDEVQTSSQTNSVDGALNSMSLKSIIDASAPVNINVSNQGAVNINSMEIQYKVDAAAPVVQTFNFAPPGLSPMCNANLTFTTPVSGLTAGSHTIVVTINKTNGAADPITTNNTKQKIFAYVLTTSSVTRNGLMEEFSSATCAPCASFNGTFDPLATSNQANVPASHYNLVKYQMNWPSPGNDASYNTHGNTRRGYYGVNGIPDHFTNGAQGGNGDQAEITASKTGNAYATIAGTYKVNATNATSGTLKVDITVTPKFTITGAAFYVQAVASERAYQNPANTNGQLNYIQAERTMFPSGSGTLSANWTAGTAQTFSFTKPYTIGGAAQGNDNFWGDPMNSDLVVFLQDNEDHTVYQSQSIPATAGVSVSNVKGLDNMVLFPNPANDFAVLGFSTTETANIDIAITDVLGHTVYTYAQRFEAGTQRISIPTADFASGIYNVRISTPNGTASQRLTIAK